MTVRIDPDLLAALKRRAKEEGRSVSSEVVRLIRREVEGRPPPKRGRSLLGMFARGHESIEIEEIRALRRDVTGTVERSVRRRVKR